MAPVIQYEHVTKLYRSLWAGQSVRALDDFSLVVERGEIFGFLGPNGAGKTTALHLAMGFMRPTSGGGRMLDAPFGHASTRRRVGFLGENAALYHRPAESLLRFYGALNGMRDPELRRAVREALETLELTELARRNVKKFSRGLAQRVGLAQAMVNDPDLLILDEPTSALDPLARVAVRELLLRFRAAGKTIFLSSHLLSEIETVCDRVAILFRGRVVKLGRTSELLESAERCEISARGITAGAFAGAVASNGLVRLTVSRAEQRAVIERVWALGGEVVQVNPQRRSLEEVFLELAKQ